MRTDIIESVQQLANGLLEQRLKLAAVESCTGGLIAASLTDVAGSSAWFDRGWVVYSNEAKQQMLGVAAETLSRFGAVSEETAAELVSGAIERSDASIAFSVTGIAGPSGGSIDKPVGTVCFGFSYAGRRFTETQHFDGDREQVRYAATTYVLNTLINLIKD